MKTLRRTIHPEVKVIDERTGLVSYVASDETLDSYREVIRADGWRFDNFEKNAPFVDSHNYYSIENQVGKVIDYRVDGRRLVETVKWATDVPDNKLAQFGFAMTAAGYLKAVSVGFIPTKMVSKLDRDPNPYQEMCEEMGLESGKVAAIYLEQQQLELSACIIGANPNALAKAYKAGVLNDEALELLSTEYAKRETADSARGPAEAESARQRARTAFMVGIQTKIKKI